MSAVGAGSRRRATRHTTASPPSGGSHDPDAVDRRADRRPDVPFNLSADRPGSVQRGEVGRPTNSGCENSTPESTIVTGTPGPGGVRVSTCTSARHHSCGTSGSVKSRIALGSVDRESRRRGARRRGRDDKRADEGRKGEEGEPHDHVDLSRRRQDERGLRIAVGRPWGRAFRPFAALIGGVELHTGNSRS